MVLESFYWTGFLCFFVGIFLLIEKLSIGAGLIMFASPCLLLYPIIRYLFGGKDSVGVVVATVVVEEMLKDVLRKASERK